MHNVSEVVPVARPFADSEGSMVPRVEFLRPITNRRPKAGRNAKCPACNSGRKFKVCCGKAVGTMPSVRK